MTQNDVQTDDGGLAPYFRYFDLQAEVGERDERLYALEHERNAVETACRAREIPDVEAAAKLSILDGLIRAAALALEGARADRDAARPYKWPAPPGGSKAWAYREEWNQKLEDQKERFAEKMRAQRMPEGHIKINIHNNMIGRLSPAQQRSVAEIEKSLADQDARASEEHLHALWKVARRAKENVKRLDAVEAANNKENEA